MILPDLRHVYKFYNIGFSNAFDFARVVRWHLIPKRFALRRGKAGVRVCRRGCVVEDRRRSGLGRGGAMEKALNGSAGGRDDRAFLL